MTLKIKDKNYLEETLLETFYIKKFELQGSFCGLRMRIRYFPGFGSGSGWPKKIGSDRIRIRNTGFIIYMKEYKYACLTPTKLNNGGVHNLPVSVFLRVLQKCSIFCHFYPKKCQKCMPECPVPTPTQQFYAVLLINDNL